MNINLRFLNLRPIAKSVLLVTILTAEVYASPFSLAAKQDSPNLCGEVAFNQAPEVVTGPNPKGVAIADFDGDGLQDIGAAFQDTSGGSITAGFSVVRNLGSNQFAPKIDISMPSQTMSIESIFIQDLDGDGKVDVVISSSLNNQISIFRNTSTGPGAISFASRNDYTTGGNKASSVAFGDFDADGKMDIAVGNQDSNTSISIFRNVSAGVGAITLAPKSEFPLQSGTVGVITTGDFNNDGKLDIAIGGSALVFLANVSSGPGNFNFTTSSVFNLSNSARGIVARDFDGDGKLDIAVANGIGNSVSVLRNISSGSGSIDFAAKQEFTPFSAPWDIASSDIDGDGKMDIVVVSQNQNSISVLRNTSQSPGVISFAPRLWDFGAGISPYRLAVGDLNADGKPDIVTANWQGSSVSVLISSGTIGNVDFISRKDYLTSNNRPITSTGAADFDGDGYLDILGGFDNIDTFSVYPNNGAGHFASRLDFSPVAAPVTSIRPDFVAAGDLDNDGKKDVVMVGSWLEDESEFYGVRVFRNMSSGPGNFDFRLSSYSKDLGPQLLLQFNKVFVVDFDGDGKNEIVTTYLPDNFNDTVLILRNTTAGPGSISFAPASTFALRGKPDLSFADLDMDNKLDIAFLATTGPPDHIIAELNTSSTAAQFSFAERGIDLTGVTQSYTRALALGDIDNDGKKDFIVGDGQNIYVSKNTSSPGTLTAGPTSTFSNLFLTPLAVADFDGDGKKDILTNNSILTGSFLSILRNTTADGFVTLVTMDHVAFGAAANTSGGTLNTYLTGDFDNNGRVDFAGSGGPISVLLAKPCAASLATISGKVTTPDGRGLRNASISMTDSMNVVRTATTSSFGFFSFANVPIGGQYVLRVQSRSYRYSPRTVTLNGDLTLPDFVGLE